MKRVAVVSPVLDAPGFAHLSQNRWFHFSGAGTSRIHPLLPASTATLLKKRGHEVLFLDGVNRRMSRREFDARLRGFNPDLVVVETKTPVISLHGRFFAALREWSGAATVLVGDHVSALPEESLRLGCADYCVAGGDYDWTVARLADALDGSAPLPPGMWHRGEGGTVRTTGEPELLCDLDSLPFIDRDLTRWRDYGEAYLHSPCAYVMSGRGCGTPGGEPGACVFCSWQHNFWKRTVRLRSPGNVAEEIRELAGRYRVREVFDDNDSGAYWNRAWLEDFCAAVRAFGRGGKLSLSSNARADLLDGDTCALLRGAGFRLLKVGLESGDEAALEKLGKRETAVRIAEGVRRAKDCGLAVFLTVMIGAPWDTDGALQRTYEALRSLLEYKPRLGDGFQVSLMMPYPGTPLYRQAVAENRLVCGAGDYARFDMSQPVLKTGVDLRAWGRKLWGLYGSPRFVAGNFLSVRSGADLRLALRGLRSLFVHLADWKR